MGGCTEASTKNGPVDVELRRESVIFHEDDLSTSTDQLNLFGQDGHVEITYEYMKRIAELLDEPEWRQALLGEAGC